MGALFAKEPKKPDQPEKKAAANVSEKDRAVLDLKNARDRLKKLKKKVHMAVLYILGYCIKYYHLKA